MDAQTLITCWEHGRRLHPLDRALLLYVIAAPELEPESLADQPIGHRNAALLRLRRSMFGDELRSCVECPACGERLEFCLSAGALLEGAAVDVREVYIEGARLRLPTTRDLASIASERNEESAGRRLLERICVEGARPDDDSALVAALDAADPCMDLAIELICPACAHVWSAAFDTPTFLWEEIDARARWLLDEVHVLAAAYGWEEDEILHLSDSRRRAYLDRVLA